MAMRSLVSEITVRRLTEGTRRSAICGLRYFSDSSGRILSEEERAAENVYIQKWEREKMEKKRLKAHKERAEREKASRKAEGEPQKS
ncbi:hypothetical protein NMG60_11022109 [Bertholletia excelsa]